MEYRTTNDPIPVISKENNKLNPSMYEINDISREGIQLNEELCASPF